MSKQAPSSTPLLSFTVVISAFWRRVLCPYYFFSATVPRGVSSHTLTNVTLISEAMVSDLAAHHATRGANSFFYLWLSSRVSADFAPSMLSRTFSREGAEHAPAQLVLSYICISCCSLACSSIRRPWLCILPRPHTFDLTRASVRAALTQHAVLQAVPDQYYVS